MSTRGFLLALAGLLLAGAVARADGPQAAAQPERLLQALLEAPDAELKAHERALRRLGAPVAALVRARLAAAEGRPRARLERLLRRLELDWHRAKCPAGMIYVPAGAVEVPRDKEPWGPSGRRETVPAFYIDRTEVTVAAWRTWLARLDAAEPRVAKRSGLYRPPGHVRGDLPVARVRWRDAARFAREARGGKLPTAAQFERALRGSSIATYPWGELLREGLANLRDTGPGRVQPVGSYPKGAGPFGALDLVGNVAEWTSTQVRQGRRGRYPLVVGGSFADRAEPALFWRGKARMTARMGPDEASASVGFRVVQDPPALP